MKKLQQKLTKGFINAAVLTVSMVSPVHGMKLAQGAQPPNLPPAAAGMGPAGMANPPGGGTSGGLGPAHTGAGGGATAPSDIFGQIEAPAGVADYDSAAGPGNIGLILFLSNIIKVATVVAGVWVMFNFIIAGWDYIAGSGEPKSVQNASSRMINSLIGLIIIVASYTIAGLIGVVFFGDASYIINPQIQGI